VDVSADVTFAGHNANFPLVKGSTSLDPAIGTFNTSYTPGLLGADINFHFPNDLQSVPEGVSWFVGINKYMSMGADHGGGNVSVGVGIGTPFGMGFEYNWDEFSKAEMPFPGL